MNRLVPFFSALLFVSLPAHSRGALNHDVEQATVQATICVPGYTKSVRPSTSYTNSVKIMLLRRAGIPEEMAAEYELDHIVPLALGGHPRKLENLELQPWAGHHGAKRKDRLEVKMQCLVCSGQIPLDEARRDIASDWQAAYHHYAMIKCQRNTTSTRDAWPQREE